MGDIQMKFEYQNVIDPETTNERLVLKATTDADIGRYAVFLGQNSAPGKVNSGEVTAFWFPDKQIKAGELVVLYSREGASSEKKLATGKTSHFFYWGRTTPVWTKGHTPIIVEIGTWGTGKRFE